LDSASYHYYCYLDFHLQKNGWWNGRGSGGIFNVGRSKAKLFDNEKTKVKINFTNVAGLEEAKIEVQEIVDFLKNPDKYTNWEAKFQKVHC
jgi:AFG3 family protein